MTEEPSLFARLLELQRTDKQREQLHSFRHDYVLSGNDPVWALVGVVQESCRTCQERGSTGHAPTCTCTPETAPLPLLGRGATTLLALGASVSTMLMALCVQAVSAAAKATHPWLCHEVHRSWPAQVLSVPAGWMFFAQILPVLGYVAYYGWRTKHADPAAGWTLVAAATTGCLTIVAMLAWLLH